VTRSRAFAQVDVFGAAPYLGNPVAVVLDGADLDAATMQRVAAWNNLSETTFVLPPTSPDADYGVRIFTPDGELPFAGHPTLGTAHAWLEQGGAPRAGEVVQECAAGLVRLRRGDQLEFRSPPARRDGPLKEGHVRRLAAALRVDRGDVVDARWADNGPGWAAVRLATARQVLDLEPDDVLLREHMLGVVGAHPAGSAAHVEVRAFAAASGIREDPVTGSLNAALAPWLVATGVVPPSYVAAQGTRLGRRGVVAVDVAGDDVWVGGATLTCLRGSIDV
jgi:PhzF family phenazine biosynthesis protein